jgi:hypothetical protein
VRKLLTRKDDDGDDDDVDERGKLKKVHKKGSEIKKSSS